MNLTGWLRHVMPTLRKLRQEAYHEFEISLDYRVKSCFKNKGNDSVYLIVCL